MSRHLIAFLVTAMAAGMPAAGQSSPDATIEAAIAEGRYVDAVEQARARALRMEADTGAASAAAVRAGEVYVRALILNGEGAVPATSTLAQTNVALAERAFGIDNAALAPSLVNWGQVLALNAKYVEAISALERSVRLTDGPGSSPPDRARSLDALGGVLLRAEQYDRALTVLRRSLSIKEQSGVSGHSLAATLQSIGTVLQAKGEYALARAPIERAMQVHRETGAEHPEAIDAWMQLGNQLWFESRLTESRDAQRQALALAERTLRPHHPVIAAALREVAATLSAQGDLAQAQALQQRALAIVERSSGPNSPEAAKYMNSLANSRKEAGDYPGARRLYERSLRIAVARLGERNDLVATFVHNLALTDASLGDFAASKREHARAVRIWEAVYGKYHPFVALALTEMAAVLRQEGQFADAASLLGRALNIRRRTLGSAHRDVARTLGDLALSLDRIGQSAGALVLARQALEIFERMPDAPGPDRALVLTLYGELLVRRGRFEEARTAYKTARDLRTELFAGEHPLVAEAEAGIAAAELGLANAGPAFAAASSAERVGREHLRLMLRSLPERESLNYAGSRPRGLDLMLSLANEVPGGAMAAADALVRSRALVFDEMATRQRLARADPQNLAAIEALASARQRLANLVVRGAGDLSPARYRAVLETARAESEAAERALVEENATYRAARDQTEAGVREVLSRLPEGAAVLAYRRFDRTVLTRAAAGTVMRARLRHVSSYIGFVLRRDREPVAIAIGSAREVDDLVAAWRRAVAADVEVSSTSPSRLAGSQLRRRVWDPFARELAGAGRVLIVPDGTLNLVPFGALPSGSREYLIETGPVLHYLTAERDVYDLVDSKGPAGRGLLALGGPNFGPVGRRSAPLPSAASDARSTAAQSPCGDVKDLRFEPLRGALDEVRQIAAVWQASPRGGEPLRVLTGIEASEDEFKRDAPGFRVLHLATHGFFLSDECPAVLPGSRAVGGLAPSPQPSAAAAVPTGLVLSALALAGANQRSGARPNVDDGVLAAEEVAVLQLAGVEWAVLSACDTGLGQLVSGEGVMGLRRAFQVAGARTVIMSLWPVNDLTTRALMRELYDARLVRGLSSDEAVRSASLSVLRGRRASGRNTSPFYWAAFVAAGDWR